MVGQAPDGDASEGDDAVSNLFGTDNDSDFSDAEEEPAPAPAAASTTTQNGDAGNGAGVEEGDEVFFSPEDIALAM